MASYMNSFFSLITYCNTQMINANEYNIARVILEHVNEIDSMSLENLSNESNISQASVSRFIKKLGYKNYQDFRESFKKALLEIKLNRKLSHVTLFPYRDKQDIVDTLYENAINNLTKTKEIIDLKQLNRIINILKNAHSVTFFGDDHALSIFYTLQLDLMANEIPTYLFKIEEIQSLHSEFIGDEDVIVFLNVYSGFITPKQRSMLKEIRKLKNVKMIGFTQEYKPSWDDFFNEVIHYGISNSVNDGFFSLQLLAQILSELMYE